MTIVSQQKRTAWLALLPLVLAAGCNRHHSAPPPRTSDPVPVPQQSSIIAVPIDADPAALTRAIEQAIPLTLWTIEQHIDQCVPAQHVKLFGVRLKVTPALGCTVVGTVTRGPVHLHGEGHEIVADLPIHATIAARKVGGVLDGTATGAAMAHVHITLGISTDWTPHGTVRIRYDWTRPPGIAFLGGRITFTDKADEKLRPVIARLEKTLPQELARMDLKRRAERLWRQSFTAIELNGKTPPVWMRVTPQKLFYDDYSIGGGRLRLNLGMEALTETFVGPRPADPVPTPLPPLQHRASGGALRFFIPVVADYAELEPVLMRALTRRSTRPFAVPGLGAVNAHFDKVVAYGTTSGRIAVGLTLSANPVRSVDTATRGTIWLTATPANTPGSARVSFNGLEVTGDTDGLVGNLLIKLGNAPALSDMVAESLGQNFTGDLRDLLGKIRRAISNKRVGDFVIRANVTRVETGRIRAHGQGLFLPVRLTGVARISYSPASERGS